MRILGKLILLWVLFVMIGCSDPWWVKINLDQLNTELQDKALKNYTVGRTETAFIGQPIIKIKEYKITKEPTLSEAPQCH